MSDYCYSFPVLNRIIAQGERMDIMKSAIGVDPLVAVRCDNGDSWYQARTRCIECAPDRHCKVWLDTSSPDQPRLPLSFCPNAAFCLDCRANVSAAVVHLG